MTDEKTKAPKTKLAEAISRESIKKGLFLEPGGRRRNCLRISPPLVITPEQISGAAEILDEVVASAFR